MYNNAKNVFVSERLSKCIYREIRIKFCRSDVYVIYGIQKCRCQTCDATKI